MIPFSDWFPLALLGVIYTLLGCLKLYGFVRGFVGGRDKPFLQYACGT